MRHATITTVVMGLVLAVACVGASASPSSGAAQSATVVEPAPIDGHSHAPGGGDEVAAAATRLDPEGAIICRRCGQHLTRRKHVVTPPKSDRLESVRVETALSAAAPLLTFRNPHNQQHEVATFSHVDNIEPASFSSTKESYFPGYRWRPVRCGHCHTHLGWGYEDPNVQQVAPPKKKKPASTPPSSRGQARQGAPSLKALVNMCQTLPQVWRWCGFFFFRCGFQRRTCCASVSG